MARILRGEIRWAGRNPVLVLSHNVFNEHSGTVIALAITSQEPRAGFPLVWPMPAGMLKRPAWVKVGQIRTLAVERIGRRMACLDDLQIDEVMVGLKEILGE